jgi:Mn2+/Fe2+ NRAMP family transporter
LPWGQVLHDLVVPHIVPSSAFWMTIVAVLGTSISPYLFFWQASQEVEELQQQGIRPRREKLRHVVRALKRLRLDTITGMVLSNAIAFFVMLMGAVALHATGQTDVRTAAQAAQALRPLAGDMAFTLFAIGIIATGMLAVPVLASSAAYAVAESFGWPEGLERHWREAKGFYTIIIVATLAGTGLSFTPIDAMKALFWSAVINGVVSVPIMAAMMLLAASPAVMGPLVVRRLTRVFGWGAVGLMTAAVVMMGRGLLQ